MTCIEVYLNSNDYILEDIYIKLFGKIKTEIRYVFDYKNRFRNGNNLRSNIYTSLSISNTPYLFAESDTNGKSS